jgi:hypoxanthine-DNA glycosylase
MQSIGFPFFASPDARVLILGSLPGKMSLEQGQYYAHPRNGFWPIMGELVGAKPELPYKQRIAKLTESGIALWDVCARGYREGSLDSAIEKPVPNDFAAFFRKHKHIKRICFNGAKSNEMYKRYVLPTLSDEARAIERLVLPSTSPAHAARTFEQKLVLWRAALCKI